MPQRITSQAKKSKSPFVVVETEFVNNQKDADCTLLYQMLKICLIFCTKHIQVFNIAAGLLKLTAGKTKSLAIISKESVSFNDRFVIYAMTLAINPFFGSDTTTDDHGDLITVS